MVAPHTHIELLTTGGTIASRRDPAGAYTPQDSAHDVAALLDSADLPPGVELAEREVLRSPSFALTLADLATITTEALAAASAPGTTGVVITHGTDTLEETAILLDLAAPDGPQDAPIVLTGAQRPADAIDRDGPGNLRDAVAVAASPGARGMGTLIVFDGLILPARATRKVHTLARRAFAAPDAGPVGYLRQDGIAWVARPAARQHPLLPVDARLSQMRVDVVSSYPGADGTAVRGAGQADGFVLVGTGAGNVTPQLAAAAIAAIERGAVVALTSRTGAGPVAAIYGQGGAADLVAAGALLAGHLPASQARIVLAASLAAGLSPPEIAARFLDR